MTRRFGYFFVLTVEDLEPLLRNRMRLFGSCRFVFVAEDLEPLLVYITRRFFVLVVEDLESLLF